jgi:hypothetical protein
MCGPIAQLGERGTEANSTCQGQVFDPPLGHHPLDGYFLNLLDIGHLTKQLGRYVIDHRLITRSVYGTLIGLGRAAVE